LITNYAVASGQPEAYQESAVACGQAEAPLKINSPERKQNLTLRKRECSTLEHGHGSKAARHLVPPLGGLPLQRQNSRERKQNLTLRRRECSTLEHGHGSKAARHLVPPLGGLPLQRQNSRERK